MFYVYVITGPGGKQYVGVSKNVKERWRSHVRRAFGEGRKHPLYDAIRKHGADSFAVAEVAAFETQEAVLLSEVFEIAVRRATDRAYGYNVSMGGEYDCVDGPRIFWERMRADPVAFEKYRANLSAAQQKRADAGLITAHGLVAYNAAKTPRERWKQIHRAGRAAKRSPNKGGGPTVPCGNAEAVRAAWEAQPPSFKKRHSITSRKNATALWAKRTPEQKADVAAKVAASVRALHDDPVYRERNLAALAKGMRNVDRAKQGAAASEGLKRFWRDLKADPDRYADYKARQAATLQATLRAKSCVG